MINISTLKCINKIGSRYLEKNEGEMGGGTNRLEIFSRRVRNYAELKLRIY